MATTTTLGFSILSRYSGHGVTQARRDLAALRAQMSTLNDDLDKHTNLLGGIPSRWKAIGGAAAAIAPALIPIGAAALQSAGALTAMSVSVGAALGAYGMAMKGAITQTLAMAKAGKALSPVQKEFVSSVNGMKGAWKDFIKQTQGQTLDTATHVVRGLTDGIKLLKPLIDAVHPSLLQVAKDFESWMKGPSAKEYSGIIAGIAKTSMPLLVQAGKNVLNVLGDGFRALAPLANDVARAILKGSEALRSWSDGGGFQRFLSYVKDNGSAVNDFWKAFGAAIANVFNIVKQFSSGGLSILTDALRAIAAIQPGSVQAFANALLLVRSPLLWLLLNCPPLRDLIISLIGAMNPQMIYAVAAAFVVLRVAFMLMNTALLTTPLGWLIIGLVALGVAITLIATKTTWFQTAWSATWGAVKVAAEAVWTALQIAFTAFVNAMITAWTSVSTALVAAWNAVWSGMSTAVQATWSALTTAWNAVVYGFATAWTTVSTALVTAWNAVWMGLQTAAQAVWTALTAAWSAFTSGLATAWTTVSTALTTAWNAVWTGMQTAAQAVWTAMQTAWNAFITGLQTIWTTVSAALTAAWSATWTALQTAAQAVWTALQTAWQAVMTALTTAWTATSAALTASWSTVWNALKTAAQAVWTALKAAWHAFLTAMQTAWTATSSALTAAWNATWNAIKAAGQAVWDAMKTAWQAFLTAIQTLWTTAGNALKTAWDAVWNALKTSSRAVWDAMHDAWDAFLKAIRSLWDGFANALKTAWEAVWNALKTSSRAVWDAIHDAWNAFLKACTSLFEGFASALKKSWQETWDTVKKVASEIWGDIKKAVETGVNAILKPINLLIEGFNKIASAVKLDIKIPTISVNFANGGLVGGPAEFAAGGTVNFSRGGGVLGGYAPGRDTVPSMLSKGEGVLVPEAVRGLGGAGFVHWANSHYSNGRGGKRGYGKHGRQQGGMHHFAGGGIAGMGETMARMGGNLFAAGGVTPVPPPGTPASGQGSGTAAGGTAPKRADGSTATQDGGGFGPGNPLTLGDDIASMVLGFIGKQAFEKILNPLIDNIAPNFGPVGEILGGAAKFLGKSMIEFFVKKDDEEKKKFESMAVAGSQSVQAWAPLAREAMVLGGLDPAQLPKFLALMQAESGGNPNAINNTDINAKNGVPSQGLMQVIPPTFTAYHVAGTSNNILDPLANMAAAANYIKHRYGGNVPGSPYVLGTPGATAGTHLVGENGPELINFQGGETVTPAGETNSILTGMTPTLPDVTATTMPAAADVTANMPQLPDLQGWFSEIIAAASQMQSVVQQAWDSNVAATENGSPVLKSSSEEVSTAAQASYQAMLQGAFAPAEEHQGTTMPLTAQTMATASGTAWTTMSAQALAMWTAMRDTTFAQAELHQSTTMPADSLLMQQAHDLAWTTMNATSTEQFTAIRDNNLLPFEEHLGVTIPQAATTMNEQVTAAFNSMRDAIVAAMDAGIAKMDEFIAKAGEAISKTQELVAAVQEAQAAIASMAAAGSAGGAAGGAGGGVSGNVESWRAMALQAMGMAGLDTGQIDAFLALMQAESSGDPNAINNTDINAQNGIPSQGLMQVIPPTFQQYHVAGTSDNILDPLANMAASAAYIVARYGGVVPGSPYKTGTNSAFGGVHLVGENGPELVGADGPAYAMFSGGQSVLPAAPTMSLLGALDQTISAIDDFIAKVDAAITKANQMIASAKAATAAAGALGGAGGITGDLAAALAAAGNPPIIQGPYSNGALSAGTHSGGGVVDVPIEYFQAMLNAGFIGWIRSGGVWAGNEHAHMLLPGTTDFSPAAAWQVQDYYAGGTGLNIPAGLAKGTNRASSGWTWVGEKGPELMRMRGGEQVKPHHKSMDWMDRMQSTWSPVADWVHARGGDSPEYTPRPQGQEMRDFGRDHLTKPHDHSGDIKFEIHTHGSASADDVVDGIKSEVLPKLRQYLNVGTGCN